MCPPVRTQARFFTLCRQAPIPTYELRKYITAKDLPNNKFHQTKARPSLAKAIKIREMAFSHSQNGWSGLAYSKCGFAKVSSFSVFLRGIG
jgi:hypothetical protein